MPQSASSSPTLENTDARQEALRRYHILDTAPEKDFDRITSLVARVCDVSTALITLIDKERQWFKSCFNFNARETDISVSFCVHAVHEGEMLVVEDATKDPRFKDNPIVTGPPHIRFYAGAPLTTPEGIHIGTLCIIDYEPKTFDAAQREILDRLADLVVNQFELRSAEAQVRQLIDENPQPMYVYAQRDGHIMKANGAAISMYGYDTQDFASLTASDLRAPASHQDPSAVIDLHKHADGSYFPVRMRQRQVLVDGKPSVLATVQPTPLHSPNATSMVIDRDGVIRSVSHDNTDDGPLRDVVGTEFQALSNPFDQGAISDAVEAVLDGTRTVISREVMIDADNGSRPYEAHLRPLRSGSGQVVGVNAVLVPPADAQNERADTASAPDAPDASDTAEAPADTESTDATEGLLEQAETTLAEDTAPHDADHDAETDADAASPDVSPDPSDEPAQGDTVPAATEKDTAPEGASHEEAEREAATANSEPPAAKSPSTGETPAAKAPAEASESTESAESAEGQSASDTSKQAESVRTENAPNGDGTSDAAPTAMPDAFSNTAASTLLRRLREREDSTDERSARHSE